MNAIPRPATAREKGQPETNKAKSKKGTKKV